MKFSSIRYNKIRIRHLLSYLLLSMLPIVMCGTLIVLSTYNRRVDSLNQNTLNGLHLFSGTYSRLLNSMDSCAGHFEDNLKMYEEQGEYTICTQIAAYKNNYDMFMDVLYYTRGADSIYTDVGMRNYHEFEIDFMKEYNVDLNMTTLFSSMNSVISECALRGRMTNELENEGKYVFYLKPIPTLDAKPKGVMVFIVSTELFKDWLTEYVPSDYSIYICYDRYLSWLFRSEGEGNENALIERLSKLGASRIENTRINGENYILFSDSNESKSAYHMMAYDASKLYEDLIADRNRSIMFLIILLIPVAAFAYMLHKNMYTPIDRLLKLPLPNAADEKDNGRIDELLGNVARGTQYVISQNDELREQTRDQQAMLKTQAALALINGRKGFKNDVSTSEYKNIYGRFTLYENYTVLFAEKCEIDEAAFYHGELREYLSAGNNMFIVPLETIGQLAVLINHIGIERAEIANAVLSILDSLKIHFECIGVGLTCSRERIPVSLLQAQVAARTEMTDMRIHYFDNDSTEERLNVFLPVNGKMLLCQCIRNGETQIALSTFENMKCDILPLSDNEAIMRSWAFFILDAISGVLRETGNHDIIKELTLDDVLCMDQSRYMHVLDNVLTAACERIAMQREYDKEEEKDAIIKYIDAHFCETDMSLNRVCSEFKFSESYINRILKDKTGQSFLQYVSGKRMTFVKKQLRDSDEPIKDIVIRAGYIDVANFTRKFRNMEGLTPGAYRDMNRA